MKETNCPLILSSGFGDCSFRGEINQQRWKSLYCTSYVWIRLSSESCSFNSQILTHICGFQCKRYMDEIYCSNYSSAITAAKKFFCKMVWRDSSIPYGMMNACWVHLSHHNPLPYTFISFVYTAKGILVTQNTTAPFVDESLQSLSLIRCLGMTAEKKYLNRDSVCDWLR